ncbi:hypothetical protein SCANM63S_06223 [Streptomyces canarius]
MCAIRKHGTTVTRAAQRPTPRSPHRSIATRLVATASSEAPAAQDHTSPTMALDRPSCCTTITGVAASSRPSARLDNASPTTSQASAGSARRVAQPVRHPPAAGPVASPGCAGGRCMRGVMAADTTDKPPIAVSMPLKPAHCKRSPPAAGPARAAAWSMPSRTDWTRCAASPASRLATAPTLSAAMKLNWVRHPAHAARSITSPGAVASSAVAKAGTARAATSARAVAASRKTRMGPKRSTARPARANVHSRGAHAMMKAIPVSDDDLVVASTSKGMP